VPVSKRLPRARDADDVGIDETLRRDLSEVMACWRISRSSA
jgi:hypothetical protein